MPDTKEPVQPQEAGRSSEPPQGLDNLADDIHRHIVSTLGHDIHGRNKFRYFNGLAYSIRDRLIQMWLSTQRDYYDSLVKRVYYLSLEFLPGRFLMNYLTNMRMEQGCREVLEKLGMALEEIEEVEWDAGLGNGGLGRLASCYLDSMASLKIPGYGYGILYDYGIFYQRIVNGYQEESCDNWRRQGSPWEIVRREHLYEINFYGRSEAYRDAGGNQRHRWVDTRNVMAMPCDILIRVTAATTLPTCGCGPPSRAVTSISATSTGATNAGAMHEQASP